MSIARVTLLDWDTVKNDGKEPIVAELDYSHIAELGTTKVSIYVGDDITGGNVMIPVILLTTLMGHVMQKAEQRDSAIIMPNKKIILPN